MQLRTAVTIILGGSVLVWIMALCLFRYPLTPDLLKPFGLTSTIVSFGAVMFEKYVWRWGILRGWLVERPFLGGTWRAVLHSTYEKDGVRIPPKEVFVVIRQTLTSMTFRLYTDRARSHSLAESIYKEQKDLYALSISYQSDPAIDQRNGQSEIHYGAALFNHIDGGRGPITGHYFTDRKTSGSLELIERKNAYATSFAEAASHFV